MPPMGKEIRHQIGAKIKKLRREEGLTQAQLSEMSQIKYKYIQEIEGKNPPNIRVDTLERLARVFRIKPGKLLDF